MHTTGTPRSATPCLRPAIPAADAGSEKSPSSVRSSVHASRISSSLTVISAPPEPEIASSTHFACTGSVMRIAEAKVSGRWAAPTGYGAGVLVELHGDRHLPLDPVFASARVDERGAGLACELLRVREGVREGAFDLEDPAADGPNLHELRGRDRAGGHDGHRLDACA